MTERPILFSGPMVRAICPECGCESRVIVDEHDDPREGDELLDCAGRRLLVDMVTDAHVYVRVTDGAGGLVYAVRVERARWQAACLGFEPAPA